MQKQGGIVILFAVLTIGLLVGVGATMATLAQKQLILSNLGKQSQVAFYAADTGAECARYWDYKKGAFFTPDPDTGDFPSVNISCNGTAPTPINRTANRVSFQLNLTHSSNSPVAYSYSYCAAVSVTKNLVSGQTTITSRGYNLPCAATYSSRKVERAVQLTY